jgi:hypothetical protein
VSLRLRIILLGSDSPREGTVAIYFTGDHADVAAKAMAEWLSEEIPDLLSDTGVDYDKPNLN